MVKCPHCYAENRDDSRYCSNCAAPLGPADPEAPALTRTLETPVSVLKPGALVAGKFRIVDEIGRGGMGIVYKAEDIKLKRPVALKFLPPGHALGERNKRRFIIEVHAALDMPSLVMKSGGR